MVAVLKVNHVAALNPSETGEDRPTNIFNVSKTNPKAYSMASSRTTSGHYNRISTQPVCIDEHRHDTYKMNRENRVYHTSKVPGLIVLRSVREPFTYAVDYRNYSLTKKSSRFDNDDLNELYKMTKNTTA